MRTTALLAAAATTAVAVTAAGAAAATDPWDLVKAELDKLRDDKHFNFSKFSLSAGDGTGPMFHYEDAGYTMDQRMLLASASKFPSACVVVQTIADGHMTFDTKASDLFEWWSSDPADKRSGVTLRQLLSFTSGLYWKDASSGDVPCLAGAGGFEFTPEECAQQIYERAPWEFEPGTTFAYNSFHLQVAGAMAAKASNRTVRALIDSLFERVGMNHSGYLPGQNPMMAAAMYTIGYDYEKLLTQYIAYDLFPKEVCDEMEKDYLSAPYATHVANSSLPLTEWFGHYSMANWFECMSSITPGAPEWPSHKFTQACLEDDLHLDEGLFGYYPFTDRKNQYWFQIPQEVIVGLNDPNPAANSATRLRARIKPWLDWVIVDNATGPPPQSFYAADDVAPEPANPKQPRQQQQQQQQQPRPPPPFDRSMGISQSTWDALVEQYLALP